ncbi:protein kinase domain-containing protein [Actinomadura terrae]|uniref:protein kinase domain-containing protein n=1 Tax=Actinomadura terrae TaxID=604353 RepID=UPI001FA7BA71|nr:PQQ-binding-like beta-propeller repeat protein [Actinomadura terrae]
MEPLQRGDPERVGPYRLLGRLGAGGMGVVYLGRSRAGRAVAVKVVRRSFAGDARYAERFRREVAAARRVTGTFTAPVLDADPDAVPPWLVIAYLPGLSLREAVLAFGPLPAASVRPLAAGVAEALAAIHRAGVVHRDLKPGNVMLTAGGPRVIDFGVARPEDAVTITRTGAHIGTPGFMAPEQLRGDRAGPAADVFAMGATLAYAATGTEPFGAGAPRSRDLRAMTARADLDAITEPWLREVVGACLRAEPADRPSAVEVLEMVGEDIPSLFAAGWFPAPIADEIERRAADTSAVTEVPVEQLHAATAPPDATRPGGRRAFLLGAGAVAGALAVGGAGLRAWPSGGPRTPGFPGPSPAPEPSERWTRRVADALPKIKAADGVVLASGAIDDGGERSTVGAIDSRTGSILWDRYGGLSGLLHGGVAYLSLGGALGAVRARTGQDLWHYETPSGESPALEMAIVGSVLCYGSDPVAGLDLADRRRGWKSEIVGEVVLLAADGLLIALSTEAMIGMDPRTGRSRWTRPIDDGNDPVGADGLVFSWDRFGTLHAVRTDSGALAWKREHLTGFSMQAGGGRVYAEGRDGEVLALETRTGRPVWSRTVARLQDDPAAQATACCLSGATLYVACANENLYALDVADGRVQWSYRAGATARIAPVSADGLVFVGMEDGRVRALAPPP